MKPQEPSPAAPSSPGGKSRGFPRLAAALGALALAGTVLRAAPPAAGKAPGAADLSRLFERIGPDYKKAQELPDTFFNPFKVEATLELSMQKRGAAVTEQSIAEAVGRRGVSGLLYSTQAGMNQVIIGDQVFRVGDELSFPEGDSGAAAPLLPGASVILREIGDRSLVFDFTAEVESSRRSTFSLRSFWRP
jgi:hypothetical protein